MNQRLIAILGGAALALALLAGAGAFVFTRPSRAAYIETTPEPVAMGADTVSVPPSIAPTVTGDDGTVALADRALIAAPALFPGQDQLAQSTPIIVSFSAQGAEMQRLCSEIGGVLDSGLCSVRRLAVSTVDTAGVHVALTDAQAQTFARVRAAGVALVVATDNAVLMATTTAQQPAAAPTAPAQTVAPTAAAAPQKRQAATFVDGLPLLPIAGGALLILLLGGGAVALRRRSGASERRSLPKLGGGRAASPPPTLSLNLGGVEVSPLIDDEAAIAASVPRESSSSFTSDDGGFAFDAPAAAPTRSRAPAPAVPDDTAAFLFADATPAAAETRAPGLSGAAVGEPASPQLAGGLAAAEALAPAVDGTVFNTRPGVTLFGVLDDLPPAPSAPPEPIIPRLGPPLPPARPADPLPPAAALDRQAALRWVQQPDA